MLKSMKRNPLKHIEKNLAFSIDGSCSSVYEVNGFGYDHKDESTKSVLPQSTRFIYPPRIRCTVSCHSTNNRL